jgi:hypothetical protein
MSSPQMLDSGTILPRGSVATTRVIWAAMILGQLATAFVLATLTVRGQSPKGPHPSDDVMIMIAGAMLLAAVVVTFVVREFFRFDTVTGEAGIRGRYAMRTIVPMAVLEAASFTGMILVFLCGKWMPVGIVPVAALVIQLALFPRSGCRGRTLRKGSQCRESQPTSCTSGRERCRGSGG